MSRSIHKTQPRPDSPMVSVILSTYNQPEWLELTLWAYAKQVGAGKMEIVIADDGSRAETTDRINQIRPHFPYAIEHVWQPDQGFAKCAALNKAIGRARSDYLIFSDGDCLPRTDFVAQHLQLRRPGRFLSGGYIKLPMVTSLAIGRAQIDCGDHTNYQWLTEHGLPVNRKSIRLKFGPKRAHLMDLISTAGATWNGHNASGWKSDIVAVNGFDERLQYGGEDREFGERLVRAGVRGLRIRHRALVVHLDHEREYAQPEMIKANMAIRIAGAKLHTRWTEFGLRPGPPPGSMTEGT